MNKLAEILAALSAAESFPDDWDTQITEAYEFDLGIPNAKVSSLEEIIAQKDAEIARLKIHNYDLLMNGSIENVEEVEEVEEVDEELTTDDLFGDEEEEN